MIFSKNNDFTDELCITAHMLFALLLSYTLLDIADELGIIKPNALDMIMEYGATRNNHLYILHKKEFSPAKIHADTTRFCNYIKKNICLPGKLVKYDIEMFEHDTHYFVLISCTEK